MKNPPPVFLLLVFLAGCGLRVTPPAIPTGTRTPASAEFLPPVFTATPTHTVPPGADGEFDVRAALDKLYGAEGSLETDSQGDPIIRVPGVPGSDDPREKIIRILLAAPYKEAGEEKYILLTETGPEGMGAHAEFALIGGALFHRVRDSWVIEIEQREIDWMGSFGHAPPGELLAIGPDKHGFLFVPQWAGQGSVVEYARLIGIVGAEFKLIFDHEMRFHSEGEDAVWDYSSAMEFIAGGNPDYFDIRMTTEGAKPIRGTVTPFRQIEVFAFDGREYVLKDSGIG